MESKTKRLLLIGGSVIVVAGVAWYFIKQRNKVSESEDDAILDDANATPENVTPQTPPAQQNLPVELNTQDKVKKFQDFMDSIGPWLKGADGKYKKLSKGSGYGIAGPSTRAVFNVYGDL